MSKLISELEQEQLKQDVPDFAPGDTVVVYVRVTEGNRERLQAYEGIVIAKRNRGLNSSFTVRKISHGEGVERVFQTHSPAVAKIELKRRGDVRTCSSFVLCYPPAMRQWTERQALIATVAYALQQNRPLLRRIVAETHPNPESPLDPATTAAERIIEHLELSRYEVRERGEEPKPHRML